MNAERAAARLFDLIDARQIAQAESAVVTALEKFPGNDSVLAADALITLRKGNYRLAKMKALELSEKNVTKPEAVNALVHVLQNCCCWDALATTYERLKPIQNERQISENQIQAYVRMGAYERVQQVATQLYRRYNDPKYQVWMVQAMLAQVPADCSDHMLLKLSTKLVDAAVLSKKGCIAPSTVQTYVDLLAQQGHFDTAIDFLLSERAAKIGLLTMRLEVLARMLQKAGRTSAANAVAQYVWMQGSDSWIPFTIYKDTLLPAADLEAGQEGNASSVLEVLGPVPEMRTTIDCATAHHSLEEGVQLARELQVQEEEKHPNKLRRGPYLAELDLLHSLHSPDMQSRVLAYVERFYNKPSCYLDISTFLTPEIAASVREWSCSPTASIEGDGLDGHTRRILGLRCFLGSWEKTPSSEVLRALFLECREAYQQSRHLSKSLVWSAEGLCDGYITVAMNVALRGYAADKDSPDYSYLVQGLELMGEVDRRMNNPAWLMYAVSFANLLGLSDCAALRQLAFKNVQRDTMAHVGYWPMLTGLALEDVAHWDSWAEDFYSRQERDCSLLRAKVFNYMSWPAMQDIQRYEAIQANSLYRWQCPANEFTSALLQCQTHKDVVDCFETRVDMLWAAWERLSAPGAADTLLDNTDWVVAKSMILGNIHSTTVQQLTESLLHVPSRDWQVRRSRQLLASIFLLHDMTAISSHRRALNQAKKKHKGKSARSDGVATSAAVAPVLYSPRLATPLGSVEYLPVLQPLSSVLCAYVDSLGEAEPEAASASAELRAYLQSLVAESEYSAARFEAFLYPQAYILSALLKMAPTTKLPVKQWVTDVRETLEVAQSRYKSRSWFTLTTTVGSASVRSTRELEGITLTPGGFAAKLEDEKVNRIVRYVSNLKVETTAHEL